MTVKINNESVELESGITLAQLAVSRKLPDKGIAVAVNNNMVIRTEWEKAVLKDGDDIVILKAFCGG